MHELNRTSVRIRPSGWFLSLLSLSALLLTSLPSPGVDPSLIHNDGLRQPDPPTRDSIDESTLRKHVTEARRRAELVETKTLPLNEKPPSTESSLRSSSILIASGSEYTIVPIGSVLKLPSQLRARIVAQPEGSPVMWPDFLKRNSSWLATKEVSLAMAKGDPNASQAVMRELATDTRLVVAVYKGAPITTLTPSNRTGALEQR